MWSRGSVSAIRAWVVFTEPRVLPLRGGRTTGARRAHLSQDALAELGTHNADATNRYRLRLKK